MYRCHPRSITQKIDVIPNPYQSDLRINYTLKQPGSPVLNIFDINGRKVKSEMISWQAAGDYQLVLHDTGLFPGLYFVQLRFDNESVTRKIIRQ